MKYKVQMGFEHEILDTERALNMKYKLQIGFEHEIPKLQIGFEHEIQGTDRL